MRICMHDIVLICTRTNACTLAIDLAAACHSGQFPTNKLATIHCEFKLYQDCTSGVHVPVYTRYVYKINKESLAHI